MQYRLIKDLKKGDLFILKPIEEPKESQVYIRGDYDREDKKYFCQKWNDIGDGRLLKGETKVYTEFTF